MHYPAVRCYDAQKHIFKSPVFRTILESKYAEGASLIAIQELAQCPDYPVGICSPVIKNWIHTGAACEINFYDEIETRLQTFKQLMHAVTC